MGGTIALAGNPNCGKTTLFNALTGARQAVGNWAGVTVEKKTGKVLYGGQWLEIVDLPGTYSLAPYSPEEKCTRDFLLHGGADVVLCVLDGTKLERNLYLALQLMELNIPLVLAVNMMDEVRRHGGEIDCKRLSELLGVAVVAVAAREGEGLPALLHSLKQALHTHHRAAVKLPPPDERYVLLEKICAQVVRGPFQAIPPLTKRIDSVVTHRVFAIPIFLGLMLAMFSTVFGPVGRSLKVILERFFALWLAPNAAELLQTFHAPQWLCGLLVEGVIGGVGSVLAFLPQMALLFLCLSLLEQSGYMARAAFIMDWPLRKIGLSGKAFIPMLTGFGCTTPAIMAARTLETEHDRRLTVLLLPFFSCGARLPVYALFAGTFFAEQQGLVVFGLYVLGVLTAALAGRILCGTVLRGNHAPFLLELPAYRLPTLRGTLLHLRERCGGFVMRAGTVLFWMSILVWMLRSFDCSLGYLGGGSMENSMFARLGELLAPLLAPLGFGTWQAAAALISGVVAKEGVVSTLAVLCGGTEGLVSALAGLFTPQAACAFLVFTLLYTPCVAALATMRRELGSLWLMLCSALGTTAFAYAAAFVVYRIACIVW